jgi:redox-sensitive bicupin YhaK (pirin superfamily)
LHSEYNRGQETLRFLQIWIFPDEKGHEPDYGDHRFPWEARKNAWLLIASGPGGDAPVTIQQDVRISAVELEAGRELGYAVGPGRQAYLLQIEGSSSVNGVELDERDALEIVEEDVVVRSSTTSHLFVIEMAKAA